MFEENQHTDISALSEDAQRQLRLFEAEDIRVVLVLVMGMTSLFQIQNSLLVRGLNTATKRTCRLFYFWRAWRFSFFDNR